MVGIIWVTGVSLCLLLWYFKLVFLTITIATALLTFSLFQFLKTYYINYIQPSQMSFFAVGEDSFNDENDYTLINSSPTLQSTLYNNLIPLKDSDHDVLTGLPNLQYLLTRITQCIHDIKNNSHYHFALLFIDVDNFKLINKEHNTDIGDEILKAITHRLQCTFTDNVSISRLGADKFIIMLNDIHHSRDCFNALQKGFGIFKKPFELQNQQFKLTISVGISVYPYDGREAKVLLRSADIALYKAKIAGGNNSQFYSDALSKQTLTNLNLEEDLYHAFSKNEFFLQYQPIVDLQTGKVIALEALIRWLHPDKGIIPPKVFLPLVEENGLVNLLSEWVVQTACMQLNQWQSEGLNKIKMSINISNIELKNKNFVKMIDRALLANHIDPNLLEIELTEDILIESTHEAMKVLSQLNHRQVALSIDNFGTGYSSLSYLKRLPIRKLKIDKDFIRSIPDNREDAVIVKSIIAMSQSLGLITTAEGVENREQLAFLTHHQCHTAQGFFLAKPMNAEQCTAYLWQNMSEEEL